MGQLCPNLGDTEVSQPRNGVAKRHDNFDDVKHAAQSFEGHPITRLDMMRAVTQGLPKLSDGARCLLGFYVSHLDATRIVAGQCSVWPGNTAACQALGKTHPTIRRLKAELEKAGFIIRRYDRRNRPLDGDAIDLSPLLAQIPDIIGEIEERANGRRTRWEEMRNADRTSNPSCGQSETSGQALENKPLNSPLKKSVSCLNLMGKNKEKPHQKSNPTFDNSDIEIKINDQQSIDEALALSPCLKAVLTPNEASISADQAVKRIWLVLADLFPNEVANSINHTFLWCAKRHGAKAFLYLAIALEDPMARDPRRLFGWFATNPNEIDVTRNLERIRHKPRPILQNDRKPNLPGNAFEDEIGEVICEKIGISNYNSWFSPQSIRYAANTDKLIIEHGGAFAREEILKRFKAQLGAAAASLGFTGFEIKHLE